MRSRRRKYDPSISAVHAARYLAVDFVELVEKLDEIEEDLSNEAYLRITESLQTKGAEARGDVIYCQDKYYRPTVYIDWPRRALKIDIRCLSESRRTVDNVREISEFGLVRYIEITTDTIFSPHIDNIFNELSMLYHAAYTSLQNAYVAGYSKWISELFTDVYTLVNTQLEILGRSDLRDRFWFSVTALGKGTFRYHFSVENVRNAIGWFRRNQNPVISPVEGVTMLLTQDVPDGFLGTPKPQSIIMYDERTRIVEFASLPTLGSQTSFWLAERSLFASNSLTALQVAITDNQAFEMNFPVEHVTIMSDAIQTVREDLVRIIGERYNEFRKDQRRIRSAVERLQQLGGGVGRVAKDVSLQLTAKVITDLLSGKYQI
jgi:hypothetical protein